MANRNLGAMNETANATPKRLMSLDALRGFDMFWILGADGLVHGLRKLTDARPVAVLADQMEHVAWEGFHFYDLIFPLFVFLMGSSAVYSLNKIVREAGVAAAYRRLVLRSLTLYLLGLFYYGGLSREDGLEMFRYVGVLQRIAICYCCAGLIHLNFRWRGVVAWIALLLVGYWLAMTWIPVPDYGRANFAEGKNLANYIDQVALPGYKWDGPWDPEGLLSTIPAVATALLGVCAALILRSSGRTEIQKLGLLVGVGMACLAAGLMWGMEFPIIKKLWTSSYVLYAGGWSFLLLAFFYGVIDVVDIRRWAMPFVWIGSNCLAIYLLDNIISFRDLVERVIHSDTEAMLGSYGPLVVSMLALSLPVAICWLLYRRRIFIRL